ncbi:hypothetical protein CYMTET_47559 [Cymbomonas tetramitiformis]|uniref:Uncharacterized protein n=1 Tax=Cymbomonas tetramitiformis TaxID=36881 RepID=A0AAE0BV27_9CHLO|nr:hypothetical protein CYMTET_47559 [Cymbomonas tetramitiformis]
MGPDLDQGEADRREGAERLALMNRAWEDAFKETDCATQDGSGGGTQESEGTQREQSGQTSGGAGEAGAMASRLLESMEDVRREAEHLGTVGGQGKGTAEARSGERVQAQAVDTCRAPQSPGAHPGSDDHLKQFARQHTASHQLPCLQGEVAGHAGTNSEQLSGRQRPDGELSATGRAWDTQATVGMGPQVGTVRVTVTAQVWSALLKFAAPSQGNQRKGSSHGELVLGVEGYRRKSVADAQAVGGSGVMWDVGLVVEGWLDWRRLGGRDEPASGTRRQCADSADAEGVGWLSEA